MTWISLLRLPSYCRNGIYPGPAKLSVVEGKQTGVAAGDERFTAMRLNLQALLSFGQVGSADAVVPAEGVNIHKRPEQAHDHGSG